MKKFVNNNQFILSPKGYFILGAEIKIPGQSFVKLYSQRLENALAMNVPKDFAEKYLEIEKRSNIMTAQETIDLLKRERYVKPELVWANRNLAVFYAGRPEEQKWPVPTKKEMQELREKIRRRQANAGSNGF
ncbi:MAG: hypothetical protein Q8O89_00230, partial [Nanoarchaeota archaeon]|nr:hypothetical protein [Nanoarchaeota archaeon]